MNNVVIGNCWLCAGVTGNGVTNRSRRASAHGLLELIWPSLRRKSFWSIEGWVALIVLDLEHFGGSIGVKDGAPKAAAKCCKWTSVYRAIAMKFEEVRGVEGWRGFQFQAFWDRFWCSWKAHCTVLLATVLASYNEHFSQRSQSQN